MTGPKHFYLTFNPFLNTENEAEYTQAHEFYDLISGIVKKDKKGSAHWGKIIGKDRTSSFDIETYSKVIEQNKELGCSTHLYITDFQNLWVAKVDSLKKTINKKDQTLPFYTDKNVEVWFEITDMALLEHNHEETANKLSEIYIDNEFNELKIDGLSPFTTGIKYPCIIQDISEEQYFDEIDTSETSHLIFKPNPAIHSNSAGQVLKNIHTYAFSEALYSKIPHAAKMEIESAELDMLENKHHNASRVAFSYIKALEIIMNDLIVGHLKRKGFGSDFYIDNSSAPPKMYLSQTKDHLVPLKTFQKNFSMNQLIYFVERCEKQNHVSFKKAFSEHKQFVRFILGDLDKLIKENCLIHIRGIIAHNSSDAITQHDALAVRNIVLGIGCKGLINLCYQKFFPQLFVSQFKVLGEYDNKGDKDYSKSKKNLKLVG